MRRARLRSIAVAFASIIAVLFNESGNAQPMPAKEWARLADWNSQLDECAKASGRSFAEGMQCKLAQAEKLPPINVAMREWFGEFYDPKKYRQCLIEARKPTELSCEYLRLMREPEPEYWPGPERPLIKWPEVPKTSVYRPGMTSKEYFDALCKAEAGEFIYRTVETVDGIYQIRPRKQASWYALQDRYVMEDPYGYTNWEAQNPERIFVRGKFALYEHFEATPQQKAAPAYRPDRFDPSVFFPPAPGATIERYFGYDGKTEKTLRKEYDSHTKSRHGFTWRGIKRPNDRELAIAGGELAVVDLQTGEILGIRRGFARSGFDRISRSGIQWETAEVCPRLRRQPDGWDKSGDFSYWFISKVLKPAKIKAVAE